MPTTETPFITNWRTLNTVLVAVGSTVANFGEAGDALRNRGGDVSTLSPLEMLRAISSVIRTRNEAEVAQEIANAAATTLTVEDFDGRRYEAVWGEGYFEPKTIDVGLDFFTEDLGYAAEDFDRLWALKVGETVDFSTPGSVHTVRRTA